MSHMLLNPPTVAFSKRGKQRLVLDCRYDIEHVNLFKVKFEDIRIAKMLYDKFFLSFTYGLTSAYHYIEIFENQMTFQGLFIRVARQNTCVQRLAVRDQDNRAYLTKVTKVVINIIRGICFKLMFLYDGIGGHTDLKPLLVIAISQSDRLSNLDFY